MYIPNIAPPKTQANTIALIEVEFIWSRIYRRSVYSLKTTGVPLTRFPFRSTLSSTRSAIVVAAVEGRNCQKYLGGNYRQRGTLPSLEWTKCLVNVRALSDARSRSGVNGEARSSARVR
jgi:hypothetical protein